MTIIPSFASWLTAAPLLAAALSELNIFPATSLLSASPIGSAD